MLVCRICQARVYMLTSLSRHLSPSKHMTPLSCILNSAVRDPETRTAQSGTTQFNYLCVVMIRPVRRPHAAHVTLLSGLSPLPLLHHQLLGVLGGIPKLLLGRCQSQGCLPAPSQLLLLSVGGNLGAGSHLSGLRQP